MPVPTMSLLSTTDWGAHGSWKAGSQASSASEPTTLGGGEASGVADGDGERADVGATVGSTVGATEGEGGGGGWLVHARTTTANSVAIAPPRGRPRLRARSRNPELRIGSITTSGKGPLGRSCRRPSDSNQELLLTIPSLRRARLERIASIGPALTPPSATAERPRSDDARLAQACHRHEWPGPGRRKAPASPPRPL